MDPRSFDTLARSLAHPQSRRGLFGAALALAAGAYARQPADAQFTCAPGQSPNKKGDCSCPAGTDACPDGCFNLNKDIANCGECGQGCFGGICKKGECRCPAGSIMCDGVCLSRQDLSDYVLTCGACGIVCPSGLLCSNGACECPPGLEDCNGACVSTGSDPNNCGACGTSCDDGNDCTTDSCIEGVCQNEPDLGRTCAGGDGFCNFLGECECQIGFRLCGSGSTSDCCPSETGCNPDGTCACISSGEICTTGINTCAFCCSGSFECISGNFGCTCD